MNKDLDSAVPAADSYAPAATAKRSRRLRVGALLNANALLATTALVIAFDPKLPPHKGD